MISKKDEVLYSSMKTNVIIAIGNCKYKYIDNLLKSNLDATKVYELFTSQRALKCDKNKSILLCDDNVINTKSKLLGIIEEKCRSIEKNEQLILYFSGHGANVNNELMLLLYDSNPDTGENSLSFREIEQIIKLNNIESSIIILDACFSGLATYEQKSVGRNALLDLIDKVKGTTVLASSRGTENSNEKSPSELSMFTHFLCNALSGDVESQNDGLLTSMTLHEYITKQIRKYGLEINRTQIPAFKTKVDGLQIIGNYLFFDIDDKYVKDNTVIVNVKSYKNLYLWLSNVKHTLKDGQYNDIKDLTYEIIINIFEHGKATKTTVTINSNSIRIAGDGDEFDQIKECKKSKHGLGVMLGIIEKKYKGFIAVDYNKNDNCYLISVNKEVVFLFKEEYITHFGELVDEDIILSPITYKYYWFREEPQCSAPSFRFKLRKTVTDKIPKGSFALVPDPYEEKEYEVVEGIAEKKESFL